MLTSLRLCRVFLTHWLIRGWTPRFLGGLLGLSLLLGAQLSQAQTIRYVKPTASGRGDGSSWANASDKLQDMITASGSADQVWVARGTFKPTTGTDRNASFSLKDGVSIYGGFQGSETALNQRSLTLPSSTTLSGILDNNTPINSYHIIKNTGVGNSAVLDGFLIIGGNATADNNGGGMYNDHSSPTLRNCSFQFNYGKDGGAMYNEGANGVSNPVLINCSFLANAAFNSGGALFNRATTAGSASPVLTNCSFQYNYASSQNGGALFNDGTDGSSSPVLTNCSFQNNNARLDGGALYNDNSSPFIRNCSFEDNFTQDRSGGAIYNNGYKGNSSPVLTNCSFRNNTAGGTGGGLCNFGNVGTSSPLLTNCSFHNNFSPQGGAISNFASSGAANPRLTNCVVFGNGGNNTVFNYAGGTLLLTNSLIDSGVSGYTNNGNVQTTTSSPFVGPTDTRLSDCAAAINAGSNADYNALPNQPTTDLGGNPRFYNSGQIDMGAYEYQSTYSPPTRLYVNASQTARPGDGLSWNTAFSTLEAALNHPCSQKLAEIWVAAGLYKPGLTLSMKNGVAIYGGFKGNETSLATRSLGSPLSTTISGSGVRQVFTNSNLDNTALLDGFVIADGKSEGTGLYGGGMFNNQCSFTIRNCSFQNNYSSEAGGGLYNKGANGTSTMVLINCSFLANSAFYSGGAMYNNGASPVLINCLFRTNSAASYGGAIVNGGIGSVASPVMINCAFQGNTARQGGAVCNSGFNGVASPVLTNCSFQANIASSQGGAIYTDGLDGTANPRLTNCVLFGNGGSNTIYNYGNPNPLISNSLLESNITGYTANGNVLTTATSPFVSPTDTRLSACAAAINTGSNADYNAVATSPTTDLGGNSRFFSSGPIDMGAYEYQSTYSPPTPELQALIQLYNATNGPNWTNKSNWLEGCTPCSWYGVSCDGNGRVTGLNLIGNNLTGTLPASLSALSALQSLELGANALTGGIPSGLGSLTGLQTLNLSRTQLGGNIPEWLGQLTRLQNLLLNESSLTGPLPVSLGNLAQLQNLQLYTNQLSGCFPASYTALCGRSQISFANNPNLPGGGDFGAFCANNTGSELYVAQYPQSGNACLGGPFSFSVVARGAGSYQWYKEGQRLAESGPVLSFSSVASTDAGSYQVYINYGCRPGAVQSDVFTLTVGPTSPDYQPLADLFNRTNGPSWTNKTNWLTTCDVCTWQGVTCTNGRVTGIDLTSNNLIGSLPASLSGLTSLQSLLLGTNQLTGTIPTGLGTLANLQTLILFQNSLTGGIPASLGTRTSLQVLNLSGNQLSGPIPDQLGALTQLRLLALTNNSLTGSLPASLSALTGVQVFDLSRNQLTGAIPAGYGALQNTIALNLNNNQLSGCFPTSLTALCSYGPVTESIGLPREVLARYSNAGARLAGGGINNRVNLTNNPGLPGSGDFDSFCASGAGSCNTAPVVTNVIPNQTAMVGRAFSYSLPANTFTDPDGQPLTVSVSNLPGGLTYSAGNAVISGTITSAVASPVAVTVTATDPGGLRASTSFSLIITAAPNTAPVATANASQTAMVGVAFAYTINAFGDTETPNSLTYSGAISPANGLAFNPATRLVSGTPTASGSIRLTITATDPGGLSASTSFSIAVQAAPIVVTPLALTLTASPATLLTTGTTTLSATVAGGTTSSPDHLYRYTFSGPGTITLSNNTARVANLPAGVQTFTVTVSDATAPTNQTITKTVSVTVNAPPILTALRVLHQDADNSLTNNAIKPTLQVVNEGTAPLEYGQLTLRYWLTVEQFAPLTNLSVYYAQLGTAKVKLKYVALDKPRQGAFGYVEYSFDGSAGNLAAGTNSGPIQTGIAKQDYTAFNEADDYSFASNRSLTVNSRVTAYINGQLVWGTEPAEIASQRIVKAYTENKNGASTNTISTFLQLRNEGNVALNYSDLKVRYYFTSEGSQPLNFYLDYAVLGSQKVTGQFGRLNPPLANADAYLELSFDASLGTFNPGSSTGNIQYRVAKQDWSNFSQANDYSYQNATSSLAENNRVVVYLSGQRIYGIEPGASGRLAVEETRAPLTVTVLGNPVTGTSVELSIQGAQDQPLRLQLTDIAGRLISERAVERAGSVERQQLSIGQQPAGILLLRVSTPDQSQTVKLMIAN